MPTFASTQFFATYYEHTEGINFVFPKFGLKDPSDGDITYKVGWDTSSGFNMMEVDADPSEENVFIRWVNPNSQLY